jgi:hypothetical protein
MSRTPKPGSGDAATFRSGRVCTLNRTLIGVDRSSRTQGKIATKLVISRVSRCAIQFA